ncbi:MAG TPA: gluconokinase [Candidatus Binataceae bacterium]|jgi:gluconokinase|nr:gluconokinase [Candidatus Binataceae bacterium]
MVILLMGVAGSGKTTIGKMLAARLGWPFHDADDLHSEANRAKMHRGIPLTDDDRRPWLEAVRRLIAQHVAPEHNAVIACSALKQAYRALLVTDPAVKLVYLKGSYETIAGRLSRRRGHFFNAALLDSQFAALEEPRHAIVEDIDRDPAAIVADIISRCT